jgi:histone H3/H4
LEFNFPSPVAPAAGLDDHLPNDEDDFMLQTDQAEIPYPSSDDDAAGGFTGFEVNIPDQLSEAGTTATAEAGAGIVGGGLRDEPSRRTRKQKKLSRHGIPVPLLPTGVVKRLATRFARTGASSKTKINKETLAAIEQASEWFFEQASEDLAAYSRHAGRKTIDESDVVALMRRYVPVFPYAAENISNSASICRQRHVNSTNTVFSLAQKHLPKELLQDIRLSLPP